MTDALAYRAAFGVIVPSTNTIVEADYNALRVRGVSFPTSRMYIHSPSMDSDEDFLALIKQIRASIDIAVRDVLTCKPDHMIMGMSAETFWDGKDGSAQFERRIADATGLSVTTGASACEEALNTLGVKSIAVITPYQPVADQQVLQFFSDCGFTVRRLTGLRCESATAIAEVTPERLNHEIRQLDGDDVDAIVQVGTNLSMVGVAAEAERWLGKPVLAINAATVWHALRHADINDQFEGFGSLLAQY